MVVAVLSDLIGFGLVLLPPAEWFLDAVTVVALFAALGFRWLLLPALVIEAIPGLQLFPTWTMVVAGLAATDSGAIRPRLEPK